MLGLFKKKKKDTAAPDEKVQETKAGDASEETGDAPAKKKKRFPVKRLVMILLILAAVCVSGFVVYKFWFAAPADGTAPVYTKIELPHVTLPEEMLKFSFTHFPELYKAFVAFNREMDLFEKEILRIEQIAGQYPEQEQIAFKEKKVWEKARDTLKKSFNKIEKPVKETYVLFRVNNEQGLRQVSEKSNDLTDAAQGALTSAQEMTLKLKQTDTIPEGFIRGTIYKLKKKFL